MPVRAARRRPSLSIGVKLALTYLVPTVALLGALSFVSYRAASAELEAELGKRLAGLAASTATQVRGSYLMVLAPGEEDARAYLNTRRKLEAVKAVTGVARIYVFRPDGTALCDTGTAPIGAKQYQLELDRHEIGRMFASHQAVSSTLFRGSDGRPYKAGYAVVAASEDDPTIVAGLAVEAPAEYFTRLESLRSHLTTYAVITLALYVTVSILVALLLSRPLRKLTDAAERIGKGDLEARVPVRGGDEIAFLAQTLDEMRTALRARNERLQMMLAGIAHEVRNPLGGIELFAGILREELDGDAEKRAHVAKIEREVGHLKQVVSDFLEYARRPRPDLRRLALAPLLEELREVLAQDAAAAHVTLVVEPAPAHVRADAAQLRRALLNLAKNAIQATPAEGKVTLASGPDPVDPARARVSVSDTGKGIPADSQEKIFAPFFTTKEKGTGLGLAFVREIVSDHGGTLDVTSALGRGTTFTITLPAADDPTA
jgi:signal transduction histidine kinase